MIEVASSGTATTVRLAGDVDLSSRLDLRAAAAQVNGLRDPEVIIDICGTTFIDSVGATFLISLAQAATERGAKAVLQGYDERSLFVLDICGALGAFHLDSEHRCPDTA